MAVKQSEPLGDRRRTRRRLLLRGAAGSVLPGPVALLGVHASVCAPF